MKYILPLFTLMIFVIAPTAHADNHGEKMTKPGTTVVAYHADWCGSCKILGPKMENAMNSLDAETKAKLKKVKFDFTDDATKATTKEKAEKHNLAAMLPSGEGKPPTGFVKVIDTETGAVLAKITKAMSEEEIAGVLKATAARS